MKEIKIHAVYDNPTVFHITQYKCGSQWVAEILKWCAYRRFVLPEDESNHVRGKNLVQGLVYPTLYLNRFEFDQILKENPSIANIKPFIVTRDMRDVLVSLYYSVRNSHPKGFSIVRNRHILKKLNKEDGLIYLLENQFPEIVNQQASWFGSCYPVFRYEDITHDEHNLFNQILSYCKIEVEPAHLDMVLENNSFSSITAGRKKGLENTKSHFRKGVAGDWENHFTPKLKDLFKELYSNNLIKSGYVSNDSW